MNQLFLLIEFVCVLCTILLLINFMLASHKPYKEKRTPFECGFHSFFQSRTEFTVAFFVFGITFLVLDIEIVLIVPYSVSQYDAEPLGTIGVETFIVILTIGLVYELGKKALTIYSKQESYSSKGNWRQENYSSHTYKKKEQQDYYYDTYDNVRELKSSVETLLNDSWLEFFSKKSLELLKEPSLESILNKSLALFSNELPLKSIINKPLGLLISESPLNLIENGINKCLDINALEGYGWVFPLALVSINCVYHIFMESSESSNVLSQIDANIDQAVDIMRQNQANTGQTDYNIGQIYLLAQNDIFFIYMSKMNISNFYNYLAVIDMFNVECKNQCESALCTQLFIPQQTEPKQLDLLINLNDKLKNLIEKFQEQHYRREVGKIYQLENHYLGMRRCFYDQMLNWCLPEQYREYLDKETYVESIQRIEHTGPRVGQQTIDDMSTKFAPTGSEQPSSADAPNPEQSQESGNIYIVPRTCITFEVQPLDPESTSNYVSGTRANKLREYSSDIHTEYYVSSTGQPYLTSPGSHYQEYPHITYNSDNTNLETNVTEPGPSSFTFFPNAVGNETTNVEQNIGPSVGPSVGPNVWPSVEPNVGPSVWPSVGPSVEPNVEPNVGPGIEPNVGPGIGPSVGPIEKSNVESNVEANTEPNVEANTDPNVVSYPLRRVWVVSNPFDTVIPNGGRILAFIPDPYSNAIFGDNNYHLFFIQTTEQQPDREFTSTLNELVILSNAQLSQWDTENSTYVENLGFYKKIEKNRSNLEEMRIQRYSSIENNLQKGNLSRNHINRELVRLHFEQLNKVSTWEIPETFYNKKSVIPILTYPEPSSIIMPQPINRAIIQLTNETSNLTKYQYQIGFTSYNLFWTDSAFLNNGDWKDLPWASKLVSGNWQPSAVENINNFVDQCGTEKPIVVVKSGAVNSHFAQRIRDYEPTKIAITSSKVEEWFQDIYDTLIDLGFDTKRSFWLTRAFSHIEHALGDKPRDTAALMEIFTRRPDLPEDSRFWEKFAQHLCHRYSDISDTKLSGSINVSELSKLKFSLCECHKYADVSERHMIRVAAEYIAKNRFGIDLSTLRSLD